MARQTRRLADYAGNAGTDQQQPPGGPANLDANVNDYISSSASWQRNATGLTYLFSTVAIKQVPDGLGKTLFVGEKSLQPNCYDGRGTGECPADNGSVWEGYDWDIIRWGGKGHTLPMSADAKVNNIDWRPLRDEDHKTDATSDWGNGPQWGQTNFGSLHPNGAFFTMGDGSVQTVGYSIDARIFYRLSNRRDGQNVQLQ